MYCEHLYLACNRTTKSYVPVCSLHSVLYVPWEDIIQLLMHNLIVFFLFAKNKKIQRNIYSPREAQNLWIFVVTDFELKVFLKSLANSSKSLCLKTSEQISLQPSCLPRHPWPKWEGGRTCAANSHEGRFWNNNRNLQDAPLSGFVS